MSYKIQVGKLQSRYAIIASMKFTKQKKSNNPHPEGGTIDPKLDRDLADLVKKGLIEKFTMNGETIYSLTPLGNKLAEELLKKEEKKPHKLLKISSH